MPGCGGLPFQPGLSPMACEYCRLPIKYWPRIAAMAKVCDSCVAEAKAEETVSTELASYKGDGIREGSPAHKAIDSAGAARDDRKQAVAAYRQLTEGPLKETDDG